MPDPLLQCPHCKRSLSVNRSTVGQRVECPHCGKSFVTPGVGTAHQDDADDWLSLDSDTLPAGTSNASANPPTKPQPKPPPRQTPKPSPKPQSASFEDWGDGFPELLPASEKKPNPNFGTSEFGSGSAADNFFDLGDLPDAATPSVASPYKNPKVSPPNNNTVPDDPSRPKTESPRPAALAESDEYAKEYRLKCRICGSIMYVKATQAGKTVKCSDCYTALKVPPPPRIKKKQTLDLEKVETFALGGSPEGPRKIEAFRKSAEQYLEEASREDAEVPPPDYDAASLTEWLKGIFGVFTDIGVIAHWVILSVFGSALAVLLVNFYESKIIIPASFLGCFFLFAVVISCGFAILQSVANGEQRVSDWPIFDFYAWMEPLFVAFSAFGFSVVPVWFLCHWLFGVSLISIAIAMMSLYILFPFVLLSMLDMGSPFTPFSAEVARSVTNSREAWGGLYFTAGIMFFLLFVLYGMCTTVAPPAAAVISVFTSIGCAFLYFAMIGRLAYSIGQDMIEPKHESKKPSEEA